VRLGQPRVQRQEARLGAEAQQRLHEGQPRPAGSARRPAHGLEGVLARPGLQRAEGKQDGPRAHVGLQQVEETGATDLRHLVVGHHQEVGGERHGLPGHHEEVSIVCHQHQRHGRQEQVQLQAGEARLGIGAAAEKASTPAAASPSSSRKNPDSASARR
jgi:hypothetical protein